MLQMSRSVSASSKKTLFLKKCWTSTTERFYCIYMLLLISYIRKESIVIRFSFITSKSKFFPRVNFSTGVEVLENSKRYEVGYVREFTLYINVDKTTDSLGNSIYVIINIWLIVTFHHLYNIQNSHLFEFPVSLMISISQ